MDYTVDEIKEITKLSNISLRELKDDSVYIVEVELLPDENMESVVRLKEVLDRLTQGRIKFLYVPIIDGVRQLTFKELKIKE